MTGEVRFNDDDNDRAVSTLSFDIGNMKSEGIMTTIGKISGSNVELSARENIVWPGPSILQPLDIETVPPPEVMHIDFVMPPGEISFSLWMFGAKAN